MAPHRLRPVRCVHRLSAAAAFALAAIALVLGPVRSARADRVEKSIELPGGGALRYQIITPDHFTTGQLAPVLLMLPPHPQDARAVNLALSFVDPVCRDRGWVVVCPQAPVKGGKPEFLFRDGAQALTPLLAQIRRTVNFEGQRLHVAGASDGGTSALRFALDHPDQVASVMAFPGALSDRADMNRLDRLKGVPVRLFVGSDDLVNWTDAAKLIAEAGQKAGVDVQYQIRQAQGHFIEDLKPEEIMTMLEGFRRPQGSLTGPRAEVAAALDDFHDAAAKADFARYFGRFAPEGVFIGTDAGERWTVDEFKAYAKPYFDKGKGWVYRPGNRHIDLGPAGGARPGSPIVTGGGAEIAWFDEQLEHDKYGACRGTGVLRKIGGEWKVAQYHLTVPIPTDLMERVARMIKDAAKKKK